MSIQPEDLHIQVLAGVAVATFHLGEPGKLGRRTIIFKETGRGWKIAHLHASFFALDE